MAEVHEIIEEISPYYKKKGEPETEHTLGYDSSSETLEPVYFWLLDLLTDFGLKPEKLIDNFTTTPGSGHFAEIGQRATRMQEEGMKIFGTINTVLRSVLNVVYDLKEFKIRLSHYDSLKSGDQAEKEAAILSLKQIWMDKVDIAKGQSSIKAMALGQAGFQTLIDAFLASKDEKDVDKLDLNDRVKRILKPRIMEFNHWVKQSETELRKRYQMEKTYLKSQINSLKLYSRWAKPYLKIAKDLEQKEPGRSPDLVKTFNTIVLGLTLLGKSELKVKDAAIEGDLPKDFQKMKEKRKYYSCILVDFKFRGIPQRVSQQSHYVFGGKAEVTFRGYALNEEEIKKLDQELAKSDIEESLTLIEGATTESLETLQADIDEFLEEPDEEIQKPKDTSNPFMALIGKYGKSEKPKEKESEKKEPKIEKIKPDNFIEREHLRKLSAATAEDTTFKLFDIYKKAHGMPSYT